MKTLYFDCSMGAAGDMIMSALYELIEDKEDFLTEMNDLGIPGVSLTVENSIKCGIKGTHISVMVDGIEEKSADLSCGFKHDHADDHDKHHHDHDHQKHHHGDDHSHNSMGDIKHLIDTLPLSDTVRDDVLSVYYLIAEAESTAHGRPVEQIHFHEVGTKDAIADIVGVCLLIERLAPEKILASPVNLGSGYIKCAHGILPVPAPATAHILQGVNVYSSAIKGELCTPTGAALLKHFASSFDDMPTISVEKIGYGMGTKDFEVANYLRAFIGMTSDTAEEVSELYCNLDDMTPESIAYAINVLFEAGALDVYTVPIGMKKSRPGVILCCMCQVPDIDRMAKLILRHTTTLGVRVSKMKRYTLDRTIESTETAYGSVRTKTSTGFGLSKYKYEYDDIVKIARENELTFFEVIERLKHDR